MHSLEASRGSRLRDLVVRRPLTCFLVIVLTLGWSVLALMVLMARGVLPDYGIPTPVFVLVANNLIMLPTALWITWRLDGRAGVRALLARSFRWRFGLGWWFIVLLAVPLLAIAIGLVAGGQARAVPFATVAAQLGSLISAVALINLWEETVWGGFLQTRLEHRHNIVVAAALSALPFAGVHVPLLFLGDFTAMSVVQGVASLIVLAFVVRLLFGFVMRGAANSLLAIGLMHGVFNQTNNSGGLVDAILTGVNRELCAIGATAILTAVLAGAMRGRLSRAYRTQVLEQPASA